MKFTRKAMFKRARLFVKHHYAKLRKAHGCELPPCWSCWSDAWARARKAGLA